MRGRNVMLVRCLNKLETDLINQAALGDKLPLSKIMVVVADENEALRDEKDWRAWAKDHEFIGHVRALRPTSWGQAKDGRVGRAKQETIRYE